MNHPIQKERIYLCAPGACVSASMVFDHVLSEEQLCAAILEAARRHEILSCQLRMEPDGGAFLEETHRAPAVSLTPFQGETERLIREQERRPFHREDGEWARFFYRTSGGRTELTAVVHHLICDGFSIVRLMSDIVRALNGRPVAQQPVRLLTPELLPKHPGLNPLLNALLRQQNRRWQRKGRVFLPDDIRAMQQRHGEKEAALLRFHTISGDSLSAILDLAHETGVTVGSLLAAALGSALKPGESVGVAINLRPEGIDGMGNFATGVSVKNRYDSGRSFRQNSAAFHRLLLQKQRDPGEKVFLDEFLNSLSPTLIDALAFRQDGFRNSVSDGVCRMCGYVDSPTGVSLTNLTRISLPDQSNWAFRCEAFRFVPPYMPNAAAVLGCCTFGDTMTLALRAPSEEGLKLLESALERLEKETLSSRA